MFPPSLLARLFVKGSLKNTATGFEFKIKNIIDSGTITGLGPLTVGENTIELARICVRIGEMDIPGDRVSRERPIIARAGVEIHVSIESEPLPPGSYKISMPIFTREAGKLTLVVTEPLSAE